MSNIKRPMFNVKVKRKKTEHRTFNIELSTPKKRMRKGRNGLKIADWGFEDGGRRAED